MPYARTLLQEIDKRIAEALRRVGFIGNTYDFSRGGGVVPGDSLTYGTPTATIDIGDAASAGTASSALRADAQFSFPAPSASYPQPAGTVLGDGTATTPARSDHVHAQNLTIFEVDGTPNVSNVIAIKVSTSTLTDDGGGTVTLTTGGAASSGSVYINFIIDGGGSTFGTGIWGDVKCPAGTITGAYLYADQSGSVVVDIWKDTHANFPPTVADTITASDKPTLAGASSYSDTTLTGWTTAIAEGDILRFNVDSVSTITRLTITLTATRS